MLTHIGKSSRRFLALVLVAVLMLTSLATPAALMAQSQTIQSQLTGVTISYTSPYQLMDDGQYSDDVLETMMFVGPADILAMGFMSPLIDLNGGRDLMLEVLFGELGNSVTIDRGDYTGVSYSLDMLNIDGLEMGVFSLFMNQRSHGFSEFYIFLAPPAFFGSSMQTAQNSFTINGTQLMNGVDPMVMGNMVTANIGTTGGTAVTDVTDVTEGSLSGTESRTETNTSQTTSADGSGYLASVNQHRDDFFDSWTRWNQHMSVIGDPDNATDAELQTARDGTIAEAEYWSGFTASAQQLNPPEGYEGVHNAYVAWAAEITEMGNLWIAVGNGDEAAWDQFFAKIDPLQAADDILVAEINAVPQEGSSTESQGTETSSSSSSESSSRSSRSASSSTSSESTSESNTTGSVDANEYVTVVQDHRGVFYVSLLEFNNLIALLGNEPTDAEIVDIRNGTLDIANSWVTYSSDAASLTPPAGYEGVHDEYVNWAAEVTELGNMWIGAMNQDGTSIDDFFDQMDVVLAADAELQLAIESSGDVETGGGTEVPDTSEASNSTSESSSRTSRSTRSSTSTDTNETETTGETTSETGRTTRTSRSTDTSGSDGTETSTRTTRGGQTDTSGNSSETSGRSGTTATALSNEWYMEANDVTIFWSDALDLSDAVDEPQITDPDEKEDRIYLQMTASSGVPARFHVTVFPNPSGNATGMIGTIVESPGAAQEIFGENAEVVVQEVSDDASAVLVHNEDEIGEFYIYVQVTCVSTDCDVVSLLMVVVEDDVLVDVLDVLDGGLEIDGTSISTAIPVADVEEAVSQPGN